MTLSVCAGTMRLRSHSSLSQLTSSLVGYGRTQAGIARDLGVSASFVSAVFKGDKAPTPAMLDLAGIERRTEFYVKERDG